jgi:exoribonuclease R
MAVIPDFTAVRAEFGLPDGFPPAVLAEAAASAAVRPVAGPDRLDATDVELVTIDPPGSKDLDQAVGVTRRGAGYRVHYAIADLGAVVEPGGPLDTEVRRRGQTVYLPDGSVPLHPPVLSEDAASLLPDGPRAAVLWTIDLNQDGEPSAVDVRRALVRSRARLDYAGVQADHETGRLPPAIAALPELGRLRRALAVGRGAIELELPEQEVVRAPDGTWTVQIRTRLDVEAWNAEISLLTGMAAAQIMLAGGVGLLRTLPRPEPSAVAELRRTADRLGVSWPAGATAAKVLAALPLDTPHALALRRAATTLLRGAGYAAFDSAAGAAPPDDPGHGGIGAPYAHVTAPLRRLVDRFGTEVCLALTAGREPAAGLRAALHELPGLMAASDRRTREVERAVIDATEAWLIRDRLGQTFSAVVVDAENGKGVVVLDDLAIRGRCTGQGLRPGTRVSVRLDEADVAGRTVRFTLAGTP